MGALGELLFWIVVFLVFFFGFKWLQNRKKSAVAQEKDASQTSEAKRGKHAEPGEPD